MLKKTRRDEPEHGVLLYLGNEHVQRSSVRTTQQRQREREVRTRKKSKTHINASLIFFSFLVLVRWIGFHLFVYLPFLSPKKDYLKKPRKEKKKQQRLCSLRYTLHRTFPPLYVQTPQVVSLSLCV